MKFKPQLKHYLVGSLSVCLMLLLVGILDLHSFVSGVLALGILFAILYVNKWIAGKKTLQEMSPGWRGEIAEGLFKGGLAFIGFFKNNPEKPLSGDQYRVWQAWKEIGHYQDEHGHLGFICWNMSERPYILEFPDHDTWLKEAPYWAKGRRDIVLSRLKKESDLKVEVSNKAQVWDEETHLVELGSDAKEIAKNLRKYLYKMKPGGIKIFGNWFGRPMDTLHNVIGAKASRGNLLKIQLQGAETIFVLDPKKAEITDTCFKIKSARQVKWGDKEYLESSEVAVQIEFAVTN